ncbi:hypothetical protein [Micromonospora zamorensis]|uniref:hypothetical protein n=1 Tax=Micromonospora zamorensis TaxID=709883 RepID=UPI0037B6D4AD
MRPDEFLRALTQLPPPLHERVLILRPYTRATRCDDCQGIGDAVHLALTAAHYDELTSARELLVRLADQVANRPDATFAHVKGHSGHALNEAADGLSHMARRRREESFDLRPRAHALVDAFLRDWHANATV